MGELAEQKPLAFLPVRLNGESIALTADLATPFGLVFHELTVNAAKYGSLSRPGGTVRLIGR